MRTPLQVFSDLPIERKLLLTSIIPILALLLLSLATYRSVQKFSDDEEQLNNIYLVQRRAAEYMRLVVDLETGFRGYVLTGQPRYLKPFRDASDHLSLVGDSLTDMVHSRGRQHQLIREVRRDVQQLMAEKSRLIHAVETGHPSEAKQYLEAGIGRAHMLAIRDKMDRFDRLEQDVLNDALLNISLDRTSMMVAILGGSSLALILMLLALHMIARSITWPLTALAKAVGNAKRGLLPRLPVLDRRDEIGNLTEVMNAMGAQISNHVAQVEKSEEELRSINQSLAESESKYRGLVDHAPIGIFTTRGMTVLFSNRFNRELAGLDPNEEGSPESFRQSIHPQDRERVLSEFAEAVKYDRPYETIFRFLHQDGVVRKVLSRRIPIRDAAGQTVRYQGFNIDITALDQMQSRLRKAERLATLGQVAAGIAHEIRNPLVGIGSTVSVWLDELPPSDPRRTDLEIILNETRRLDRIVNEVVDYARPRSLMPLPLDVRHLVGESLALLAVSLEDRHIIVATRLHPNVSSIEADHDQIKQVLLNVIKNAADAMPQGGTLEVGAFDLVRDGQAGVLIEIADTGVGISQADLAHVFEPFFTSGKPQGSGLGLAICRNIIDAHRGDITVESAPKQGTRVKIWLPQRQSSSLAGVAS